MLDTVTQDVDIYKAFGVKQVINARGHVTLLGGSVLSPRVQAAMEAANRSFVEMAELLDKSGHLIASMLGTEAAYVTSGCFASLVLSAAAIMVGTDRDRIPDLPFTDGLNNEFLIQSRHRYKYDRCITVAGGRRVEVGDERGTTAEQLSEAIGPRTAGILHLARVDGAQGTLPLREVLEIARSKGVAVLVDAAAEVYPLERMINFARSGADLICFGSKYFGANNSAGFLCGRRDLVETAAHNGFIDFENRENQCFGRGYKVDRQEVIATVVGLQEWFAMDHEARLQHEQQRIETIARGLADLPHVTCDQFTDRNVQLQITVDAAGLGKTARAAWQELKEGDPAIWVRLEGNNLFVVVNTLMDDEEQIVARRLREVLST